MPADESPRRDPATVAERIAQRALVESHDVYVPAESTGTSALREECTAHFRALRFAQGVARARRDPGWERDPDARLYGAIGLHYQQRYDEAREEYRRAAACSDDVTFRATCAANAATAWYEQGELDEALAGYRAALAADPANEFALLGVIGVACQRADVDAVIEGAAALRAAWPAWGARPVIADMLRKDRSYRFLRDAPGLFERALGVPLASLFR